MMFSKKESALTRKGARDPFALMRRMPPEFDRMFDELAFPSFGLFRTRPFAEAATWSPSIDVFEKDNRLVTKIDLPGMKKEDVKVEVTDGYLAISGKRKSEEEKEKKKNFYRCERAYGSFYRAVPLPEGVKLEDVNATFAERRARGEHPLARKAGSEGAHGGSAGYAEGGQAGGVMTTP
jgi:HSP20 family protein